MKRAAILLAVLLASPAWAADSWNLETSGTSWAPTAVYCDYDSANNDLWCLNLKGTSTSTALLKVDLDTHAASVVTGPTTSGTLEYQSLGVYNGYLRVSSAAQDSATIKRCTLPDCSSWTTILDTSGGSNPGAFGTLEPLVAGKDFSYVQPLRYMYGSASIQHCTDALSCSQAGTGGSGDRVQGGGAKVSSNLSIYFVYVSGNTFDWRSSTATPSECFSRTGTTPGVSVPPTRQYQAFSDGTKLVVPFLSSTTTYIYTATCSGGSLSSDLRTKASADLRPGAQYNFDGSTRSVLWDTSGTAWERATSSIAAVTGADITPPSGYTVRGAWYESGMDGPRIVLSNGTSTQVFRWGAPSSSGYRAPRSMASGPFNNFPFRGP